jgi:hypothetical protein
MLHLKLLELEAELLAKEEIERVQKIQALPPECAYFIEQVEEEIGVKLAAQAPSQWRGWLTYRRGNGDLLIIRGRSFKEAGMFGKWKAGLDVNYGLDLAGEYARKIDVTPPQDLDHLMLNFGCGKSTRLFIWYGENISPYRLIFEADVQNLSEEELSAALLEAMGWILAKPKSLTLPQFCKLKAEGKL